MKAGEDVNVLSLSPNERYLAIGGTNNVVVLYDLRRERVPLHFLSHSTNETIRYEQVIGWGGRRREYEATAMVLFVY